MMITIHYFMKKDVARRELIAALVQRGWRIHERGVIECTLNDQRYRKEMSLNQFLNLIDDQKVSVKLFWKRGDLILFNLTPSQIQFQPAGDLKYFKKDLIDLNWYQQTLMEPLLNLIDIEQFSIEV